MSKKNFSKLKKKAQSNSLCLHKMVTVSDDWYPCYPNNQIQLSLYLFDNPHYGPYTKLTAWGADDYGLELSFSVGKDGYESCYSVYKLWEEYIFNRVPENITAEWFFEHGFYPV